MIGPAIIIKIPDFVTDGECKLLLQKTGIADWNYPEESIKVMIKLCKKEGFGITAVGNIEKQALGGVAYNFLFYYSRLYLHGRDDNL